jgi:hypothetical protein
MGLDPTLIEIDRLQNRETQITEYLFTIDINEETYE